MTRPKLPHWLRHRIGPELLPLEWTALVAILLLVLAMSRLPVTYNYPLVFRLSLVMNLISFAQITAVFVALYLIVWFLRAHKGTRWVELKESWNHSLFSDRSYWTDVLRIIFVLWIVLTAHFLVKVSIHIINPLVFDVWLWRYDRWLGFGHDPVLLLLKWVHQTWLLHGIDFTYSVVYPFAFTLYVPIFALAGKTRTDRVGAITGFCLLWIVGGIVYVAFPSWGPVYTQPHFFEKTLQSMPITVHVQSELFRELKAIIDNPLGKRPVKYGGVAAFPSLHLAVITLFTLASRKISKIWFGFNLLLAAVMFVGSMLTGYHYLMGSLAGIVMGAACYRLAIDWTARRLLPRPAAGREAEGA